MPLAGGTMIGIGGALAAAVYVLDAKPRVDRHGGVRRDPDRLDPRRADFHDPDDGHGVDPERRRDPCRGGRAQRDSCSAEEAPGAVATSQRRWLRSLKAPR